MLTKDELAMQNKNSFYMMMEILEWQYDSILSKQKELIELGRAYSSIFKVAEALAEWLDTNTETGGLPCEYKDLVKKMKIKE